MKEAFSIGLWLVLTGAAISTVIFVAQTMRSKEPVSIGLYRNSEHTPGSLIYLTLVVIGGMTIVGVGVYGLLTWLPRSLDEFRVGLAGWAAILSSVGLTHLEKASFERQQLAVERAIANHIGNFDTRLDRVIKQLEEDKQASKTDTELQIARGALRLAKALKERDERTETRVIQRLLLEQEEMTSTKIDVAHVPDEGMQREGAQKSLFIKLWTAASVESYRKRDWIKMDNILFSWPSRRTEAEKRILVELVTQQWALAKQRTPYVEDDWRALRKLIQQLKNRNEGTEASV